MEGFLQTDDRRTSRPHRLDELPEEVDRLAFIVSEKDKLIESLLKKNSSLENLLATRNADILETDNEMKTCELAKQFKLNEIKTFYIQNLESQMLSLKVKGSNKLSDLLNKLTTDEYTKTIISKVALLHETLLTFSEKAERESFEIRSSEFDDEIRKAKITKPKLQQKELLQRETELTNIKHEFQTILTEKRDKVEKMTSALKMSVDNIDDLLLRHMADIMEQVQTYEKELSPILNKLAKIEETQVEKYLEILEVLQKPHDVHCSMSEAIELNESNKEM